MTDDDPSIAERELLRWSEMLSAIARTGLAFTESLYEQERFQEVLEIAAEIQAGSSLPIDPQIWSPSGRRRSDTVCPAT